MSIVLSVSSLEKIFFKVFSPPIKVISDVTFAVNEGEVFGILGSNGAGKTTLMHMLLGVLTPTRGKINFFGMDMSLQKRLILQRINFSSAYTSLPSLLTVKEALYYSNFLYNHSFSKSHFEELITIFGVEDFLGRQIRELSNGQISRVNLVKCLLSNPEIVLLDELTAALDPKTANNLRTHLKKLCSKKKLTVVLTSHNMSEVEEMCDRVMMLKNGRVVKIKNPKKLLTEYPTILLKNPKPISLFKELNAQRNFKFYFKNRVAHVELPSKQIIAYFKLLFEQKITFEEMEIKKPSLNDFFIKEV